MFKEQKKTFKEILEKLCKSWSKLLANRRGKLVCSLTIISEMGFLNGTMLRSFPLSIFDSYLNTAGVSYKKCFWNQAFSLTALQVCIKPSSACYSFTYNILLKQQMQRWAGRLSVTCCVLLIFENASWKAHSKWQVCHLMEEKSF